ncbi:MAG: MBL fold metallo-hydrolase [Desulfobacteraceae bacterium]|nr:MAG: MBL fold metallo-hydrolase [Desulfobacteraceae bacterium]
MKFQLIRNATFKITYAGMVILTDPMLSEKHCIESFAGHEKNPTVDLPMPIDEIMADIDLVLVSHLHQDHFDHIARQVLPKDLPLYCQPGDDVKLKEFGFQSVTAIDTSIDWGALTLTRTGGAHGTGEWLKILGKVSGFILKSPDEPCVYWTGDTIFNDEVREVISSVSPDVIITHSCGAALKDSGPIIMDARQTIDTCMAAPNARIIVTHMDALDHAMDTRNDIKAMAAEQGISDDRLIIPDDGQILDL